MTVFFFMQGFAAAQRAGNTLPYDCSTANYPLTKPQPVVLLPRRGDLPKSRGKSRQLRCFEMKKRRIILCAAGVLFGGVSVGFFKLAAFGVDPFQSFMSGMDKLIPIQFGTLYVLVNAVLMLFALIFNRHYINVGTFVNMFLLGYVVQFSHELLLAAFPNASMLCRIVCFVIGFVGLCFGSALYITADCGVSTYDAVALTMAHKWKLGKFKYLRIATDLCCIAVGVVTFLLGGGTFREITALIGAGTVLTAFFMGPLIDVFSKPAEAFIKGK